MLLQTVLFCAYLNSKYPRSAVPLGPLIEKLLAEESAKPSELALAASEGLYRIAFGPDAPKDAAWECFKSRLIIERL